MVPAFWATAEVVPHRGTVRVDNERVRDAEQRLGVGRVALLVQPREAVVAGRDEVEADLLGPDGVGNGLLSMRLAKLGCVVHTPATPIAGSRGGETGPVRDHARVTR